MKILSSFACLFDSREQLVILIPTVVFAFVAALLEALCARKCLQGKANIELPEVVQDQAKMKPAAGSRL